MTLARISVVVVTHNRPADIERCLKSIRGQTIPAQVVVVDNASDPGKSPSVMAPCEMLLRSECFLGPADAKNLAFKHVTEAVTVLLDDDAELSQPDALERVLRVFSADRGIGCLALNCQGTWLGGPPVEQMGLLPSDYNGQPGRTVAGEMAWPAPEFIGAGCAFRTEVFRSLGGFPSTYGYGYEEPHLSYRIIDAGWEILYVRSIEVRHYHSTDWRLPPADRLSSQLRNKWAMVTELLPLRWIPVALLGFTGRIVRDALRARAWRFDLLTAPTSGFAAGWRRRRPVRASTVRRILAIRGRL